MVMFKFEALDPQGNINKGTIEGDTMRLARSRLRDMQLTPLKIETLADESLTGTTSFFNRRRFSSAELCLVTRQISTLLSAGLTIHQVMGAIIEQSENEYTKEIIQGVRAEVMAGNTLSRAFAKYPHVFPDIYRSIVYAGEESGELSQVMLRLAEYTESRNVLKQKVIVAFIYPALVTVVALLVISGLLIYVVPQVVSAFEQSHQSLPWLTVALITLSDFLRASWLYLIALAGIAALSARQALTNPTIRFRWHEQMLRLPMIGVLIKGLNTARLASTLAILVGSGVPIINGLKAAAQIISNLPMKHSVEVAIDMVRNGSPLSKALKASNLFPPILIHLIASAEATGRLDQMLESAAAQQSREMENRIALLTALLEPLLILIMGAMVLAIVIAILLPIIEMNQLVK